MMNVNNTQAITAAIAALTQAVETLTVIMSELTMTETTTTEPAETTEATSTTETTTATTTPEEKAMNDPKSIVVLDDEDNIIAVGTTTTTETTTETTTAETTEATSTTETTTATTTEAEIKNQISVGDLAEITDEAREIDLPAIYAILKYALHKEGRNEERDRSPYAPDHNMMADIGHCCKIYLAEFDDEISIIVKHRDYASPLMRKTITKLGDFKEQENPALLFITGSVKAESDIRRFLDVYGHIKDLIINNK